MLLLLSWYLVKRFFTENSEAAGKLPNFWQPNQDPNQEKFAFWKGKPVASVRCSITCSFRPEPQESIATEKLRQTKKKFFIDSVAIERKKRIKMKYKSKNSLNSDFHKFVNFRKAQNKIFFGKTKKRFWYFPDDIFNTHWLLTTGF